MFSIIAIILLSATAVTAQTGAAQESRPRTGLRKISHRGGKTLAADRRVVRLGPSTTYLKNGLSTSEVLRLMGEPAMVSERAEGETKVITYVFLRSQGRALVTEFANDLLISSRTESGDIVRAEVREKSVAQ
jgi:hypothetical protein